MADAHEAFKRLMEYGAERAHRDRVIFDLCDAIIAFGEESEREVQYIRPIPPEHVNMLSDVARTLLDSMRPLHEESTNG